MSVPLGRPFEVLPGKEVAMLCRLMLSIGIAAIGLSAVPLHAVAQTQPQPQSLCGDRKDIAERLDAKYDETPNGIGITNEGKLLEVFASDDGTWTILMTRPNGQSCLVIHGEGWKHLAKEQPPQISDDTIF